MSKVKKIIVCLVVSILLLCMGFGILYYVKTNKIVTVLTMDINPSISIGLNYKNKVIKVDGLNEDGKKLIKDNKIEGKPLEVAIEGITEMVIEKGYITENDNYILINVNGKDIREEVVTLINNEFKENNTECNIITQEISDGAKDNAKKYGISESKASYIESVLKENDNIKFEDLKDKSINEIQNIIEINDEEKELEEDKKEDDKKQENDKQNVSINNNSNNNNPSNTTTTKKITTKPIYKAPASNDRSGAWCEFYKTIPPEGGVDYETPGYISDTEVYVEEAKKHMPADANWSSYFRSITQYRTGSYCSAGIVELENYEKTKTYTMYLDSVTLEVLEFKTTDIVKPNIDEAGARPIIANWLMSTYGVNIDDCDWENYYYAIDGSTKIPEWQYTCKIEETKTYYAVTVVATDGTTKTGYTWTN